MTDFKVAILSRSGSYLEHLNGLPLIVEYKWFDHMDQSNIIDRYNVVVVVIHLVVFVHDHAIDLVKTSIAVGITRAGPNSQILSIAIDTVTCGDDPVGGDYGTATVVSLLILKRYLVGIGLDHGIFTADNTTLRVIEFWK